LGKAGKLRTPILLSNGSGRLTAELKYAAIPHGDVTVAVIIPTFNHARFLGDAIASVLAQTRPADEIIVIDDGSIDNPTAVVAQFPNVRMIRQDNRGLSAARNTGLRNCTANYVVFLDADDRLLPIALQAGLACFADRPDCAFVYGRHRLISEDGHTILPEPDYSIEEDAGLLAFLRGIPIVIHDVLYKRDCLLALNGFDETLQRCEDYDLHLRIVQKYSIVSHATLVAEYRRHDKNMSDAHVEQLRTVLRIISRYKACIATDAVTRAALKEGLARKRNFYVHQMFTAAVTRWQMHRKYGVLVSDLIRAAQWSPYVVMGRLLGSVGRHFWRGWVL
jgi:glycosyltransferase involved in cell wall biosynthesis